MKVLDLFSGLGGFSLGLERAGMQTVAFCEIEPFQRAVLKKHWPEVPCYEDVRTLTAERLAADGIAVDVICGGFPCQDLSVAGKGAGISGSRSGLWSEITRLVRDLEPRFVILENVSVLLARGISDVLGDLASLGYDAEWHCIPAYYVGSPQARDRVWIVAYPMQSRGTRGRAGWDWWGEKSKGQAGFVDWCSDEKANDKLWLEPPLDRVAYGVSRSVDSINSLGNAVVPQIPEMIGRAIMESQK